MTPEQKAVYQQAIDAAKVEFDEVFPVYKQFRDRVLYLRQFITAGHELVGEPLQPDEECSIWHDRFIAANIRSQMEARGKRKPQPQPGQPVFRGGGGPGRDPA